MIDVFESMARRNPQGVCFTAVDDAGGETAYTYRQTRMMAAALARLLQMRGVRRGDCLALDLPNGPAAVLLTLAAAYGSFTIIALNHRLTSGEKLSRLLELERCRDIRVAQRIDEAAAASLIDQVQALLRGEGPAAEGAFVRTGERPDSTLGAALSEQGSTRSRPLSARALRRPPYGKTARRHIAATPRQDAEEGVVHFAERAAHVFDEGARALIMFTSGTTGKPKAVPLTWENLIRSAEASNASLNRPGVGLWQAVLPLYHVGGFQVVVRSLANGTPFLLYRRFDAARLLADAARYGATHVSVVDKMLQDMIDAATAGIDEDGDGPGPDALSRYTCILLGGGAINPKTLARALAAKARVFASYGMTETSSQIASGLVTRRFTGGLSLLPGYEARIVDPAADGFGRLAVKGPGVFGGYLNARAPHTVDGYFLTGDTAALIGGKLFLKERTDDMFVSGGENIYPAEIRDKLVRVPGVNDAFVFGVPDGTWGRRPVAFVERGRGEQGADDALVPQRFAETVLASLEQRMAKIYRPKQVLVLDEFPRTGIGKIDRAELRRRYDGRIELRRIVLHRIRVPFKRPFATAKGTITDRESIVVEVVDHAGRVGLGECVAFPTDWYLPETLGEDERVLAEVLGPLALHEVYLHPSEAAASFASCPEAEDYPMARGALEPALWDLYGKIVGKPLWRLVGGTPQAMRSDGAALVPAGAVIGLGTAAEAVAAARACVEAGYRRIKLKVAPGLCAGRVRAVREACPDVMITVDANQSFVERECDELRALDALDVRWIEEPLDSRRTPNVGPTDLFSRLARLQRQIQTPICLDESIVRPDDLARSLRYPELHCYAMKIGKFGGVQPALDFMKAARALGIDVWMGGMYDTGISKRLHAALQTLPGIDAPGDIGAVARYFTDDIANPPYAIAQGSVALNEPGHAAGLGCDLDRTTLDRVLVNRTILPA